MHEHDPHETGAQEESHTGRPTRQPNSFLDREKPPFLSLPPMRYQNSYVWLVLVSALDLIATPRNEADVPTQ